MNTHSTEYETQFVPAKPGLSQQFYLRPSQYLAGVLIAALNAAVVLLLSMSLPWWAKLAAITALLISAVYYFRHDAYLSMQTSNVRLQMEAGQATITRRNGQSWSGLVLHDSFITPQMVILNVLPEGAYLSRSVIILPDSLDKDSFRQLRVLMKWSR
ncbi:MAG: protein YgfX [Candidatus Nitrotoga sp.]